MSHFHIWVRNEEIAPGVFFEGRVTYTGDELPPFLDSDLEEFGLGSGWKKIA